MNWHTLGSITASNTVPTYKNGGKTNHTQEARGKEATLTPPNGMATWLGITKELKETKEGLWTLDQGRTGEAAPARSMGPARPVGA